MRMTDLQYAGIAINLSTLSQVDMSDNDPELLTNLAFLLAAAQENIQRALGVHRPDEDEDEPPF